MFWTNIIRSLWIEYWILLDEEEFRTAMIGHEILNSYPQPFLILIYSDANTLHTRPLSNCKKSY